MNAQHQSPPPSGAPEAEPRPNPAAEDSPAEALRDAFGKLGEVQAYAGHFVAAKIDAIKLAIRNAGIMAALGIVGLIAVAAVVSTAIVLLLVGIAGAWGALLGDRVWLGDLITAVLVLAVLGIGVMVGLKMLNRSFRAKTVEKYEQRKRQERARYGHDADQYAGPRRQS